jgi:chemotaxis protein CheZ
MTDTAALQQSTPETDLFAQLASLTSNLRNALDRFRRDSRLNALAEKEIPDARQRLSHVLKLTDAAAHRTMDLVEKSGPPADRIAKEAVSLAEPWARFRSGKISVADYLDLIQRIDHFLTAARTDSEAVRANLAEVMLAQDFQDLTGQIIRGVMNLVGEVEVVLVDLSRLAGHDASVQTKTATDDNRGHGPAIPGVDHGGTVVQGQGDIDDLLSDLGI